MAGTPDGGRVVVKRLLPHLEDRQQFVRMFVDEARLTSKLVHPNVVRIDGFGEADGLHYIAMEFVDGLSLGHLLREIGGEHKLPLGQACYIVAEACAGLAYAHDKTDQHGASLQIVHRDVSPDNILISRRGEVKLADFGIAKASTQIAKTLPGQIKGKLAYMSPEQAMVSKIDHRADLFAAGVVLYELTVGKPLFDEPNDAKVLRMIVHGEYPPPFPPGYPHELEKIVRRALQKIPEQRFDSAADMRGALLRLIDATSASSALGELVDKMMPAEDALLNERDARGTEVGGGTDVGTECVLVEQDTDIERMTKPGIGPIRSSEDITGPTYMPFDAADTIKEAPAIVAQRVLEVNDDADTNKLPAIDLPASVRGVEQQRERGAAAPIVAPLVEDDDGPSPIHPDELTKSIPWKDELKERRLRQLSWIALGCAALILILVLLLT